MSLSAKARTLAAEILFEMDIEEYFEEDIKIKIKDEFKYDIKHVKVEVKPEIGEYFEKDVKNEVNGEYFEADVKINPLTTVIGIFLPPAGLYHKIDIYNCF